MLSYFFTTLAVFPDSLTDRIAHLPGLKEIRRRGFDVRFKEHTECQPIYELFRLLSLKMNLKKLTRHEIGLFSTDRIIQRLDKKIAERLKRGNFPDIKAVYSYEDGAMNTFMTAKSIGLKNIYDLPIGYWRSAREFLQFEKQRWPEWASTITGFKDSEVKLNRKDFEIELADVIMVASSFTASTLENFPGPEKKIHIIPYGFPPVHEGIRDYYDGKKRKLKLLFVGGLTQRKGIADVFEAVKQFSNDVSLTIVGQKTTHECKALDSCLKKYNYIPTLSNQRILELMRTHDVLLFPSLFEGFGLVITEAMSQGMPVITTNRTAGPDIIDHNKNGWLINAADTRVLIAAIKYLLDNPHAVEENGQNALHTAKQRPWNVYGQMLAEELKSEI
ncbi:MAG: glycosyltransferase family 4 protein [Ferruginibacter sp.]|nr:glycosyltransferase family 4 protein [Ferruginibacter sp.]